MAEIFLAEQTSVEGFSKVVALKRTLPHLSRQPEFVSMFLDEARLASRLSHPNVVQVFDFGEIENRYFLAMEYLAGENLSQISRQAQRSGRPIPLQVALQIMVGACDGLHYAHDYQEHGTALNLVHRDISPSNIMVTYQGGVKVLDFGIARALGRRQEATEAGVVKGKLPYCSPEQLNATAFDRRSDIFSLGVCFHELLTGGRLFKRDTEMLTCKAVMSDDVPQVSEVRKDLPAALDRVIARALEKSATARYQTCLELRKDLEMLFNGPPARLDEYMVNLFGQKHAAERMTIDSDVKKIPTSADVSMQASNSPARPAPQLPQNDRLTDPTATSFAIDLKPTPPGGRLSPVTGRPARRTGALIGIGALALAIGGGAWWWSGRQQATEVVNDPPAHPVATVVPAAVLPASLDVDTQPTGAALEVGGKPVPGVTPAHLDGLPAGELELRATLAGHQVLVHRLKLEAGQKANVLLPLVRRPTRFEVQAPEGARLYVDGVDRGQVREVEVAPGAHQVKVVLAGYQPFETRTNVALGETHTLSAKLVAVKHAAPGKLDVSCVPWCRVFIDGADVGRPSPLVGFEVPSGQHKLRLEHPPSGRSKESILEIKPGQTQRESAQFR